MLPRKSLWPRWIGLRPQLFLRATSSALACVRWNSLNGRKGMPGMAEGYGTASPLSTNSLGNSSLPLMLTRLSASRALISASEARRSAR